MLTELEKKTFGSLRVEIIDLNILSHCFCRKMNRSAYLWKTTSRHHIFEELTALRYMEYGLILHLTNLDDDSSSFSFREVRKAVSKSNSIAPKDKEKLFEKMKEYRTKVNFIKTKFRNIRVAHLNYDEDRNMDEFLSFSVVFQPLLLLANTIGDMIFGEEVNYRFNLGKYASEGILNFRKLTENIKIDLTSLNEF